MLSVSALVGLVAVFALRSRLAWSATTGVLALAGAGLGLGAIMVQRNASAPEWALAPLVCAALLPLNVRLLYAGEGPLRT